MANLHIAALSSKHARIEALIAEETRLPAPDTLRLAELKKQKLRLKEQLTSTH